MYTRFAVYYAPSCDTALGAFGNSWLGWDINTARQVSHPDVKNLPDEIETITQTPRKYGFHGTLKAPFHLKNDDELDYLKQSVFTFAKASKPIDLGMMQVSNLGGFVALVPVRASVELVMFASDCVTELDQFRAPLREEDIKRRLQANLSTRQEHLMRIWGYPYIMDEFRFHLTLSGKLPDPQTADVQRVLSAHLAPILSEPIAINDICLCAEREDGKFVLIERFALGA